jgi:hypothetical protein
MRHIRVYDAEREGALIKNANIRLKRITRVGVIKFNGINYLATKRSRGELRKKHSDLAQDEEQRAGLSRAIFEGHRAPWCGRRKASVN